MGLLSLVDSVADNYISPYIYLDRIKEGIEAFKKDCSRYPNQYEGLIILVVSDMQCWKGPYINQRLLLGYMDRPIKYEFNKENDSIIFQLSTYGEDLKWNTADDIRLSDDQEIRQYKFGNVIKKLKFRKQIKITLKPLVLFMILALIIYFIMEFFSKLSVMKKNKLRDN